MAARVTPGAAGRHAPKKEIVRSIPSTSKPFVRLRGRSPVVGQTAGSSTASIATFNDAPIGGSATRRPDEAITLSKMALTVVAIVDALRMLP